MGKEKQILFATILLIGTLGMVVEVENKGRDVERARNNVECNASQYEVVGVEALKLQK